MYVRLLLQSLEDQLVIGLLCSRCRGACDKRKFFRLFQRKCNFFDRSIRICICNLCGPAAASEQGQC